MARTTAPLLSFDASGQIAKTQVYAKWRGISYVRRYVIPENPTTVPQQLTRNVFRMLNGLWVYAPQLLRAPWGRYASGRPFLDRNAFVGQNVRVLRQSADMDPVIGSPGASGGIPPTGITLAQEVDAIRVTFANPDGPPGWVLNSAVAVAFRQQAPDADFSGEVVAAEDNVTQNDVLIPGLTAATTYVVSGWLVWTKDGARQAFSPSVNATLALA